MTFAEEILISKPDLEEKNASIAELRAKVEELRLDMDYQQRRREIKHEEMVKQLTDQFNGAPPSNVLGTVASYSFPQLFVCGFPFPICDGCAGYLPAANPSSFLFRSLFEGTSYFIHAKQQCRCVGPQFPQADICL